MKHPLPPRPELGTHDGLSYALFTPEAAPRAGVVICHGAGSAKESHFDFARTARDRGLAALAYDARGHGRSEGALGPGMVGDALAMCDLLREHGVSDVAVRGSSLGGFTAILAAAGSHGTVGAGVALCPAPGETLARRLRAGEPYSGAGSGPAGARASAPIASSSSSGSPASTSPPPRPRSAPPPRSC